MRPLDLRGTFWLPDSPTRTVDGRLQYDGGRPLLELDPGESLTWADSSDVEGGGPPNPSTRTNLTVGDGPLTVQLDELPDRAKYIHGETADGSVTLIESWWFPSDSWISSKDFRQEKVRPAYVLIGHHVTAETTFAEVRVCLDGLGSWIRACQRDTDRSDRADKRKAETSVIVEVPVGDLSATVTSEHHVTSHLSGWSEQTKVFLGLEGRLTVDEALYAWAPSFLGLIELVGQVKSRYVAVQLRPTCEDGELPHHVDVIHDQSRWTSDPEPTDRMTIVAPLTSPSASDGSLGRFLAAWLTRNNDHRVAVGALLSTQRSEADFVENRVASAAKAVEEVYQAIGGSTRQLTKPDHRARVDAVRSVLGDADLPEGVADWAVSVLNSRNDVPFKAKIGEMLRQAGAVGNLLLEAAPDLVDRFAAARTPSVHKGPPIDGASLHFLAAALRLATTAALVRSLGATEADLMYFVQHSSTCRHVATHLVDERDTA